MKNMSLNANEDIAEKIRTPQVRSFDHKPLPESKQKIFTQQARAFLSKISELDEKIDEPIKLV